MSSDGFHEPAATKAAIAGEPNEKDPVAAALDERVFYAADKLNETFPDSFWLIEMNQVGVIRITVRF